MEHYDVIVVGAGPIGGFVAQKLSKSGFDVLLLEEHHEIGRPIQCAGLISPRVFEILGYRCGVLNEVRGANVHSPSNQTLILDAGRTKACVIDRVVFDSTIVEKAIDDDCELLLGSNVINVKREGDGIKVKVRKNGIINEIKCKLIIGSDGASSIVARSLGLPRPKEFLSGFGAECFDVQNLDRDFVNIFVGNKIAPGFFAWIIPTEKGARIGLCTSSGEKSPYEYFQILLKKPKVKEVIGHPKIDHYITGLIPLGPLKKIYSDRALLVGDAAAQIKPLSGGGIYLGLLCGSHCADVSIAALENDDVSENRLKEYQKLIQKDVGKELKRAYQLRNIYVELKDEHLEEGFTILSDEKILKYIAKHGDIDYPTGLTKAVLKKAPKLMKFAGPVLKSLI